MKIFMFLILIISSLNAREVIYYNKTGHIIDDKNIYKNITDLKKYIKNVQLENKKIKEYKNFKVVYENDIQNAIVLELLEKNYYVYEIKNNKKNGTFKVYSNDHNLISTSKYKNDQKNGKEMVFYKNGQLQSEKLYINNKVKSEKYFLENGTLLVKN